MEFLLKTQDGETLRFDNEKEFKKAVRKQKKIEEELEQARYENRERARRENALVIVDMIQRFEQEGASGMKNHYFLNRFDLSCASRNIWNSEDTYAPMTFRTEAGGSARPDKDFACIRGDKFDTVLLNIRDEVVALHFEDTGVWAAVCVCGSQSNIRAFPKFLQDQIQALYVQRMQEKKEAAAAEVGVLTDTVLTPAGGLQKF